jgi:hypothetical protein
MDWILDTYLQTKMSYSAVKSLNHVYCGHFGTGSDVQFLPVEILERIFRLNYDICICRAEGSHTSAHDRTLSEHLPEELLVSGEEKTWPLLGDEAMAHPSLFPYSICYVCCAWNKVCMCIPDIESQAHSILRLQGELGASGELLITVHISRRDGFGSSSSDSLEHRRMKAFLEVLSGHIKRYQVVHVKTMHRSSLRYLRTDLLGGAYMLEKLYACSHSRNLRY